MGARLVVAVAEGVDPDGRGVPNIGLVHRGRGNIVVISPSGDEFVAVVIS
jgi:hypothetical protein